MINEEQNNQEQENNEDYPIYMIESSEELEELCPEEDNDMNPDNQVYN